MQFNQIKPHLFHYTRCNTPKSVTSWLGPISTLLRPGNKAPFEEMSQRWQAVSKIVSNFTGRKFEPQTCCRDERVTARPTSSVARGGARALPLA